MITKYRKIFTELISNRSNDGRVNALVNQKEFEYTRDLSRMELCRLYLKNRDYPSALYAAYILNIKYPNNQYVSEIIESLRLPPEQEKTKIDGLIKNIRH